ncbi:MAG TPA: hypothetical protein VGM98_03430 [Schlesneria sp.]
MDLKRVVREVLIKYPLPLQGDHGVAHWARVLENGRRLSELTKANLTVVFLFAVLHDSRRINESHDPLHGLRGADFAATLRGRLFDISDEEFQLLYRACEGHTHELTHPDITIQTCWDSDRLDLGRVGITPVPGRLCTDAAKSKQIIQWADGRASFHLVPQFVSEDWGIELPNERDW